ncbi:hypothetical protein [Thalassotalea euphylliae]|nr:hypothetical protein [Thalassotalea euphylliae]
MTSLEQSVISFFQPYSSCQEVRSKQGKLIGLKLVKDSSIISLSYGDSSDFHPDALIRSNGKEISTYQLFSNLFSNSPPINQYVKIQRSRVNESGGKGVLSINGNTAFIELDAHNTPEPHSITYFFDSNDREVYLSLGLTNVTKSDVMSLVLEME